MSERGTCFVLFPDDPGVTPAQIFDALGLTGLHVEPERGCWRVRWRSGPVIDVVLVREPHVREETLEIAELFADDAARAALERCDARIELSFDLEAALDESNTLIEVQAAMQKLTGGYLFNLWNQRLTPPDA